MAAHHQIKMGTDSRPISPLPPQAFETYSAAMPLKTERVVSCDYVACDQQANGWYIDCDEATELGANQAAWIRSGDNHRRWWEGHRDTNGDIQPGGRPGHITVFYFEPGQQCFREHTVNDGPMLFTVREGDWRVQGRRPLRMHSKAEHWVEDCAEAVDRFNNNRNRG